MGSIVGNVILATACSLTRSPGFTTLANVVMHVVTAFRIIEARIQFPPH